MWTFCTSAMVITSSFATWIVLLSVPSWKVTALRPGAASGYARATERNGVARGAGWITGGRGARAHPGALDKRAAQLPMTTIVVVLFMAWRLQQMDRRFARRETRGTDCLRGPVR